jgi:DegV family protein with EDD domain
MNKVRIVTDSTADLPQEIIDEYGIIVVPLKVSFGKNVYRDGVDINPRGFIDLLEKSNDFPFTSQPSPGEFVAIYEKLASKKETIISIHISGKLSGTVQSANTAKTMTDSKDIYVIDSKSTSMGLGLIVIEAAKAAKEGKSAGEIVFMVKDKIEKTLVVFLVDTLEYLEKGGRIGKASALLGSLLKIKPVLAVDDKGQVYPVDKVRGTAKAIERINKLVADTTDNTKIYNCAFVFGSDNTDVIKLKDAILPTINYRNVYTGNIGPVVMVHTGPRLIGVVLCPD